MQIASIGSWTFDGSTNIVVGGLDLDLPGTGRRARQIWEPRPISFQLAFIRSSRSAVMNAVDQFVRDLVYEETRRGFTGAIPGSISITFAGAENVSWLTDIEVTLREVRNVAQGLMVIIDVRGVLLHPPVLGGGTVTVTGVNSFASTIVQLSNDTIPLRQIDLEIVTPNTTSITDSLLVIESLPSTSSAPQTRVVSGSATIGSWIAQAMPSGHTRHLLSAGTSGSITYTITPGTTIDRVPYTVWMAVQTISAATPTVTVAWPTLPSREVLVVDTQTLYPIALYDLNITTPITVQVTNAAAGNTYVYPLIFVPLDIAACVYVVGAGKYNTLHLRDPMRSQIGLITVTNSPTARIYGYKPIITRNVAMLLHCIPTVNLSTATSTYTVVHRQLSPHWAL